ncbi:MAG: DUF481 domain-containing protein [Myxococcales bacterium]|nr:DUF481 domain-containing protein [Myxococcota bacterium]MDW8280360.1 DUF481 domain-containing protein [Myxococcales bacterium]
MHTRCLATGLMMLLAPSWAPPVHGQSLTRAGLFTTEYKFVENKEVKEVEWKASASAGFTLAAGNANVLTVSGGATASRNDGKNLVSAELSGMYSLTTLPLLIDRDSSGNICEPGSMAMGCNGLVDRGEEVGNQSKTTAGFLLFKGRYDRFVSRNNAGFVVGFIGMDTPASKSVVTGGQVGYSRQLFRNSMHEVKAELGADFTYNSYIVGPARMEISDSLFFASARLFVGYHLKLGESTQLTARAETLLNLNPAIVVERYATTGDATRVNAQVALTTKIWQRLGFRFSFSLRFDACPAPNPSLKFSPYSEVAQRILQTYTCSQQERRIEDGWDYGNNRDAAARDLAIYRVRYNQRLDLTTEANLVFNFL